MAVLFSELTGDKELDKVLAWLSGPGQRELLRPGMVKSSRIVRMAAKQKLKSQPKMRSGVMRTGFMADALTFKVKKKRSDVDLFAMVYVQRQIGVDSPYRKREFHFPGNVAHLVEFGHGGPSPAPAHPFLRPALVENSARILAAMSAESRKKLPKVVARARRKFGAKGGRLASKQFGVPLGGARAGDPRLR